MISAEWDEAAAWINLKWDRMPLDPVVARAWFPDLERYEYDDVLTAINQLVRERTIRPQLPDLLLTIKAVLAGKPAPLALPEGRAQIPDNVVSMVDAILQRQHTQRESTPKLTVIGREYRSSKPLQVERSEPLDSLQRWLTRHYVKDLRLTCAGCGGALNIGDWYLVTTEDDLIHRACEGNVRKPA